MIMFLQLTDFDNGSKILCNVNHIQRMFPLDYGARIIMVGGEYAYFTVKESFEEIHSRIARLLE